MSGLLRQITSAVFRMPRQFVLFAISRLNKGRIQCDICASSVTLDRKFKLFLLLKHILLASIFKHRYLYELFIHKCIT